MKHIFIALFLQLLFAKNVFSNITETPQAFLEQWYTQNHVTSVIVSVKDLRTNTVTRYTQGVFSHNEKIPASVDMLYGVGSISKTFVSAIMLLLQQQGKISLDNSIGNFFPQYPRWQHITIRQLLNMTSGIYNYTESPEIENLLEKRTKVATSELINLAYQHKDYFAAGKGWRYSNTNYVLAGLIIEKITKQPLAEVYDRLLLQPLNLKSTFYKDGFYSNHVTQNLAHAYLNSKDVSLFNASIYNAAGGMLMSSQDLISWVQNLFLNRKLLNLSSLQQLQTTINIPTIPPKPTGSQYGLGVYSLSLPKFGKMWWYTGVIEGYTSAFVYIPKYNKIIVAQAASWPSNDLAILFPNQPLMQYFLLRARLESETRQVGLNNKKIEVVPIK